MSLCKSVRQLRRNRDDFLEREVSSAHQFVKVFPVHEFHCDIRRRIHGADVINRDDSGMIERRSRSRFHFKTLHPLGMRSKLRRQNLQCNIASKPCIFCAIHLSHSTRTYGRENGIGAKTLIVELHSAIYYCSAWRNSTQIKQVCRPVSVSQRSLRACAEID